MNIKSLSPEQFENLIFDMIAALGLTNVTWRSPGADTGRDIEAEEVVKDFSNTHVSKRWFIECKRYKGSVDWSTIYKKVAFADGLQADYLLMCAPTKFTPTAITQVEKWNSQRRTLQIRLWPNHELERQLQSLPDVAAKYGLGVPISPGPTLVSLALTLSKTVASHYGATVFSGQSVPPMLEAAQTFSDLLAQRMEDLEKIHRILPKLEVVGAEEFWSVSGPQFKADTFALRAFLTYLYALTGEKLALRGIGEFSSQLDASQAAIEVVRKYHYIFSAICLWGDMEYQVVGDHLKLSQRNVFA